MLIEYLLKTMLDNIPDSVVQQNCSNLQSIEIIMLVCGKRSAELQQYFEINLIKNLGKMQEYLIDQKSFRELINLLHIGLLNTDWLNTAIRENLIKTFTGLFAIAPSEIHRFSEFLNKCFKIFIHLNDKQLNNIAFQSLMNHLQHVENIWSVFLIEFLLKLRPQSANLLQSVNSAELKQIFNLLDYKSLVGYKNPTIDLQVLRHLDNNSKELANSSDKDIKKIAKKLRLGESNFSNIKFILNEMNLQSQHLLNIEPRHFDTTDYDLLNVIKNDIEKCLTK